MGRSGASWLELWFITSWPALGDAHSAPCRSSPLFPTCWTRQGSKAARHASVGPRFETDTEDPAGPALCFPPAGIHKAARHASVGPRLERHTVRPAGPALCCPPAGPDKAARHASVGLGSETHTVRPAGPTLCFPPAGVHKAAMQASAGPRSETAQQASARGGHEAAQQALAGGRCKAATQASARGGQIAASTGSNDRLQLHTSFGRIFIHAKVDVRSGPRKLAARYAHAHAYTNQSMSAAL